MKSVQKRSFFWSVFYRIRTEYVQSKYGKIRTRKNSVFGHFSRSARLHLCRFLRIHQLLQIHMNPQNLTGVPRSSKFYVFIGSRLLWYKIMFIKCSCDLLLLKIISEKMLKLEQTEIELSVESNIPPKNKMKTKDTHLGQMTKSSYSQKQ